MNDKLWKIGSSGAATCAVGKLTHVGFRCQREGINRNGYDSSDAILCFYWDRRATGLLISNQKIDRHGNIGNISPSEFEEHTTRA